LKIAEIALGDGAPLVLISGLNVIESRAGAIDCAYRLGEIAERHSLPLVFKGSFDKANRSRTDGYRGPGLDEGLRVLAQVAEATGLPLLTDVHEPGQAKQVAEVVDCLQIPAFLSRQTELIAACAATGLPVNIKKGQFLSPLETRHAVEKARSFGASEVLVTERGASFGYHDLVADMRSLVRIREFAPVAFDATHAVQSPGTREGATGGNRSFVAPLARAAVATGVDALFVEVHPDPDNAPCDGESQIDFAALDELLRDVCAVDRALTHQQGS
jgi:2-dehydro-3-deoxyphosphooctonate aldolase (KDO 8-P synthase)